MTHEDRMKTPVHLPQGRPIIRTKNPIRPGWLDAIRRPIRIVANTPNDYETFLHCWRFDETECLRILLVGDLSKLPITTPLLVLPGAEDTSSIPDFCPVTHWRKCGGPVVPIPLCATRRRIRNDEATANWPCFPIETNLCAESVIAVALHRHLDSLNGK